ncbi:MAG TPA: hypothetical protein VMB84_03195 [Stellaceae bacterium]|nr:hypothetical protein [Stellaceae bacterium]
MSNMTLIEVIGIGAAVCLLVALWARPVGMFAIVFALAVVGAAILVSWNDVQAVRANRAARAALQQEQASSSPAVTVPPAGYAHAGS